MRRFRLQSQTDQGTPSGRCFRRRCTPCADCREKPGQLSMKPGRCSFISECIEAISKPIDRLDGGLPMSFVNIQLGKAGGRVELMQRSAGTLELKSCGVEIRARTSEISGQHLNEAEIVLAYCGHRWFIRTTKCNTCATVF